MSSSYHVPVLSTEVVKYLINDKSGTYVDCTLGGGGHSRLIINALSNKAKLIGIDQDGDAIKNAGDLLSAFPQVKFVKDNFKNLANILNDMNIINVDGILLDLGVSSFQIDSDKRGFSYSLDTDLDMRMNQNDEITAADILNNYSKEDLTEIFFRYGEEHKSRLIAGAIIKERQNGLLKSTFQIRNIIERIANPRYKIKSFSRIFQALRIEVNQELENLKTILDDSITLLKKGGRIVVISYHSLEDRIVKKFLKYWEDPCICPREIPSCVCNKLPEFKILTKKVIKASSEEIANNSRARSALLRVGEKI